MTNQATDQQTDFRLYLQQELIRRCKTNPRFSLRAFAGMLQIEPSALSKILNGKRSVTASMLMRLGGKMNLSPDEMERFKIHIKPRRAGYSTHQFQVLTVDAFHVIADWYHYAILELTSIKDFQPNPKWIAKTLGISVTEVNAAVERLIRLEMLEITPEGKWIDQSGSVTNIRTEFTDSAHRKLQKQILEKALAALEEVPLEMRDQTSMTMAIDTDLLPVAKKKITEFRRGLCRFLQSSNSTNQVFHLGISLYPVTKIEKGEIR